MACMMSGTMVPIPGYAPVSMIICTSSPSRSPSLLTAARMSKLSSRACPDTVRFSPRSSVHLTGRLRCFEAAATASSSREAPIFRPNEPPISPARTRTLSPSRPRRAATPFLVMCTLCVAAWKVISPRSAFQLATQPRPSMGTFWCRCTSIWKSSTRSAPAKVPGTSPNSLREWARAMLLPRFANSGGLLGSSAKAAVTTAGRSSYSTSTSSQPSSAIYRLSAITIATGSPTRRTLSVASRVNSGVGPAGANSASSGSGAGTVIASRSAPVRTATTPGSSRAAEASTESTSACANGERTNAACSIPGSLMSSTYRPAPVRMRGSSERLMLAPV